MAIQHGGVKIDVPPNWLDRSTLLFIRPPHQVPTSASVDPSTEAVSVSFLTDLSPQDALRRQFDQLRGIDPQLTLLSEEPFACGLGEGHAYIQRFRVEGRPMLQLVIACQAGDVVVLATGSAAEERFDGCREQLRQILASIRPAG